MKNFQGKNVLITGGSSGIGLALADELAQLGANIWLLGRDPQKLAKACDQVSRSRSKPDQKVMAIQTDVSDKQGLERALEGFLLDPGAPDLLINSAGITHPGLLESMDIGIHRENMEINYFGTLYTILAVLPGMIKQKSGHIVNISSLVGIHGLYGYSAYSPSKFAMRGLSDVMRYELEPYGVHVSVVFPTDTETPQLEYENSHKPPVLKALVESNTKPVSAKSVAQKILNGVKKNKYLIFPTSDGQLLYTVYSLLPGEAIYRFVDRLMVQARRKAAQDLARK